MVSAEPLFCRGPPHAAATTGGRLDSAAARNGVPRAHCAIWLGVRFSHPHAPPSLCSAGARKDTALACGPGPLVETGNQGAKNAAMAGSNTRGCAPNERILQALRH